MTLASIRVSRFVPFAATALVALAGLAIAGPLTPPPGAVSSSYKTLGEVEPRIAINLTNTPGDANSVFLISSPGAYYLTGNVTGVSGKHGIEITAAGVSVDLNGFELVGTPGSLDGVSVTGVGVANIAVRNGSLRSWGGEGVDTGFVNALSCTVENIRASFNGGVGVSVGSGSTISGCTAHNNSSAGLGGGSGSIISGCASRDNLGHGIYIGIGGSVMQCASNSNSLNGINTNGGAVVQGCTAASNAQNGIVGSTGATISGCSVRANVLNGITGVFQCVITGNNCTTNGSGGDGAGILVTASGNRIESNNCSNADRGVDVDASGNIIIKNMCKDNTVNWSFVAGNAYGPIIATPAGAAVNGNTAVSALGTTDPNANFTY